MTKRKTAKRGGKRPGAGRPKGSTTGRKMTKAITFRVDPERHEAYAAAAGGALGVAWIVPALDAAAGYSPPGRANDE